MHLIKEKVSINAFLKMKVNNYHFYLDLFHICTIIIISTDKTKDFKMDMDIKRAAFNYAMKTICFYIYLPLTVILTVLLFI